MRNPREIATWRFEQIAPFLDLSLSPADRRRAMRDRCHGEVAWPNGQRKRVPRSSLYRWIQAYQAGGYMALMPRTRSDKGKPRQDHTVWIDYAIALLLEQPRRSLYQLDAYLKLQFDGYTLSRSSLHRQLRAHPGHALVEKLRGRRTKLRGRYEARRPHESWQLDGKGPFRVRLMSGAVIPVVVLSVLDDYSRTVLATEAASSENALAAIHVFQKAAQRYGLPDRMQFDRGSAFDSDAFRHGMAQAGVHRNAVRARHPQAQGKIEAYHKALGRWFIDELCVQQVRDQAHLQELLDAAIALLYQRHKHRGIAASPQDRLAGVVSARTLSEDDLARAFFVDIDKNTDRITGEVVLPNGRFKVPADFAGRRNQFRYDPLRRRAVLIAGDRQIDLQPFMVQPLPPTRPLGVDHPQGQLQKLVDSWRGRNTVNAEAAFGLPEVFAALSALLDRSIPSSEVEARNVLDFWNRFGPIARQPFATACASTKATLGCGRSLSAYLDDLSRQIRQPRNHAPEQCDTQEERS